MRKASILYKDEEAGLLTQHDDGSFTFMYTGQWIMDASKPAISLTLPKSQQRYFSDHLMPFFFNMLQEGSNKQVLCKTMRIDPEDHFSILLASARHDTIGAVRIIKIEMD